MLGGVAGHAGLFSNAYDLARLMYCFRMGGIYGRSELLRSETVTNGRVGLMTTPNTGKRWDLTGLIRRVEKARHATKPVGQVSDILDSQGH